MALALEVVALLTSLKFPHVHRGWQHPD